jgi:hypothetical protein
MPTRTPHLGKARPIRGKQESITARLTPVVRSALEASANEAGHSMSTELELLLRAAMKAREAAANEVDGIFELGWEEARRVIAENEGAPPSASEKTYLGIKDVLKHMMTKFEKLRPLHASPPTRVEQSERAQTPSRRRLLEG